MENVPEMLQRKNWSYFVEWRNLVEAAGYTTRTQIYNLAHFGVPQERYRAVVIGSRIRDPFHMPSPTHEVNEFATVRETIGHLPALTAGERDPFDSMHITSKHRKETVDLNRYIPADGGSRRALPAGIGPQCWSKVDGFRDVYGRLHWDRPAVAITARCRTPSCGRFVHPEQHRGLSVREAALLQGFPESYVFEGPFDDKYKQIGNAVSPIFAAELARHIASEMVNGTSPNRGPEDYSDDITDALEKSFSSSIAARKRRLRADADSMLVHDQTQDELNGRAISLR